MHNRRERPIIIALATPFALFQSVTRRRPEVRCVILEKAVGHREHRDLRVRAALWGFSGIFHQRKCRLVNQSGWYGRVLAVDLS